MLFAKVPVHFSINIFYNLIVHADISIKNATLFPVALSSVIMFVIEILVVWKNVIQIPQKISDKREMSLQIPIRRLFFVENHDVLPNI